MKKTLPSLLCIFVSLAAWTQNDTIGKLKVIGDSVDKYRIKKIDEIAKDSANENYFSKGGFDRFFDKYFTQIKYERESFTEGNSASLKLLTVKPN